jgi:hypothetical protein
MKKAEQKATRNQPMKQVPARDNPRRKRFKVELIVEGDMLDKNTPISEESLHAFFQLAHSSEKPLKVMKIETRELDPAKDPLGDGE